jgi:L-threonylcarbamoyladenylate synthase
MPNPAPIVPCDERNIRTAADIISAGGLVAFGTETVYGLGADATNAEAVAKIFAAKGRPTFNPLISHVTNLNAVTNIGHVTEIATKVANTYWPGPLTLVLQKTDTCNVTKLTTAGLDTVAIRIPGRDIARGFLNACGVPIAAPSANASGGISPTQATHVASSLPGPDEGGPVLILDTGPCDVGLESTVLDLSTETPTLLRPGAVTREDIEQLIGPIALAGTDDKTPKSPGMLSRHYAPATPLRTDAVDQQTGEVVLGFGQTDITVDLNLSETGDLLEASANLFDMLHRLDALNASGIAVTPIPKMGLGNAINDRLRRAVAR